MTNLTFALVLALAVIVGGGLVAIGVYLGMAISRGVWKIASDNNLAPPVRIHEPVDDDETI